MGASSAVPFVVPAKPPRVVSAVVPAVLAGLGFGVADGLGGVERVAAFVEALPGQEAGSAPCADRGRFDADECRGLGRGEVSVGAGQFDHRLRK